MATKQTIKVDLYRVMEDAIEEGLKFGYNRAHKYNDKPGRELLVEHMLHEVMSALGNVLQFDDGGEDGPENNS